MNYLSFKGELKITNFDKTKVKLNNLFYSKCVGDEFLVLQDQEASHATQVLRKKKGDSIHVINGLGSMYECLISDISKREVSCQINSRTYYEPSEYLTIAVAPTKNRDRLEWMIEKLVEIGVKKIILLQTQNTERTKTNKNRIQKKVLSAVKQSLRFYLPEVIEMTFDEVLKLDFQFKWIAHCEQDEKTTVLEDKSQDQVVLIGPEGDFTSKEITEAKEAGFLAIDLGTHRLRTETAALVAAARVK